MFNGLKRKLILIGVLLAGGLTVAGAASSEAVTGYHN